MATCVLPLCPLKYWKVSNMRHITNLKYRCFKSNFIYCYSQFSLFNWSLLNSFRFNFFLVIKMILECWATRSWFESHAIPFLEAHRSCVHLFAINRKTNYCASICYNWREGKYETWDTMREGEIMYRVFFSPIWAGTYLKLGVLE